MKFILWTLIYWTIQNMEIWIEIGRIGKRQHLEWMNKEYSNSVRVASAIIRLFLYIYLYDHFIRFS